MDPLRSVERANPSSVDHTVDASVKTNISTDQTILSRTATLPPGTYLALGKVRTAARSSSPGTVIIRAGGVAIGPSRDLRGPVNATIPLVGVFVHGGGSVTVDIWFDRESSTTTFGVASEERFGRSLEIVRIGA